MEKEHYFCGTQQVTLSWKDGTINYSAEFGSSFLLTELPVNKKQLRSFEI